MGNRIYGCDDCQLVCPWNKFARAASHPDFKVRHGSGSQPPYGAVRLERSAVPGTHGRRLAILRIGYERWSRNIAVALGNAPRSAEVLSALQARREDASALVREHVQWALARHGIGGRSAADQV